VTRQPTTVLPASEGGTLLLTAVYMGLIVAFAGLVGAIGGRATSQPVALVISTLAIAAFFQLARHPTRVRVAHVPIKKAASLP
jgi:4-amino-4-deoxy-L-arabinose transferase-like glycosyltransferase